ncbi:peptidoglycan/LPS O-acetylase OafA/YrhL [Xanthomonas campestris]|uniref:acyltransferase family protein n=1 Tax=Xanthomonas TaxID=338 RepID=UPI000CEE781C|nr:MULTISPECIES: acyltransferase [Xanthomonas]MBB5737778.1 peptidoglycan/LPS O-acetylase OafA/YrhL [Xanthomonas sp. CFBP 8152]NIJ78682.1 peptidoglycan/LPS O-acetylase OafA/YrhL [Xanthomonas sp. CFBP 8151]PPT78073.1 acyltransferase [Xanthomonas arboricola]
MAALPARPTIRVLQAGRALAATMVVLSHSVLPTNHLVQRLPAWLAAALAHGYLGVDFFFVLSGFIIYYVNHASAGTPGWSRDYASSRISRIYLPYWPVGGALALAYTLRPALDDGDMGWSWFATLSLLPVEGQSALGVAWTLSYELMFYALAWLFFRSGHPLRCALLWASVTLLHAALGAPFAQPVEVSWRALLLHPITLEFVFGMLAARAVLSAAPWSAWVGGVVALIASASFVLDGMQRVHSPLFGLAIAGALTCLVRAEWRGWLRIGPTLLLLGDASYAIYLVHMPLMSLVARTTRRMGPLATWPVNLLLSVGAALSLGVVYHLCYERIALRQARRALARRTTR